MVLPVSDRKLVAPEHTFNGDAITVPATGIPVHGKGGVNLYIWPDGGLPVIEFVDVVVLGTGEAVAPLSEMKLVFEPDIPIDAPPKPAVPTFC